MSRYIIGVLNEFLLNKRLMNACMQLALLFMLHAKPRKVVITLFWTVAGQPFEMAIFIFHARVKDERKYRRCLTHHCAVVRC